MDKIFDGEEDRLCEDDLEEYQKAQKADTDTVFEKLFTEPRMEQ